MFQTWNFVQIHLPLFPPNESEVGVGLGSLYSCRVWFDCYRRKETGCFSTEQNQNANDSDLIKVPLQGRCLECYSYFTKDERQTYLTSPSTHGTCQKIWSLDHLAKGADVAPQESYILFSLYRWDKAVKTIVSILWMMQVSSSVLE